MRYWTSTKKGHRNMWISLSVLMAAVLLFLRPYFQHELIYGDDYMYHLARIQSLADQIRAHRIPAKIRMEMNMGYGYGTGFFYPDLFLYFPAFLVSRGIALWNAYKVFAAFIAAGCGLSMYFCCRYICGEGMSPRQAEIENDSGLFIHTEKLSEGALRETVCVSAAIVYLFSQPLQMDLYYRFALGECLAFIFVPVVIAGFFDLFCRDFRRPWILGSGYWGLLLSHPVSTVLMLIVGVILFVIHFPKLFRNTDESAVRADTERCGLSFRKIRILMVTAVSVLALSSAYWMPMLEQLAAQKLHFTEPWTTTAQQVSELSEIVSGKEHSLGSAVVLFAVIALLLSPVTDFQKKHRRIDPQGITFLLCGLAVFLSTACRPFWEMTGGLLNFLQFPWRLNLLVAALWCMGGARMLTAAGFQREKEKRPEASPEAGFVAERKASYEAGSAAEGKARVEAGSEVAALPGKLSGRQRRLQARISGGCVIAAVWSMMAGMVFVQPRMQLYAGPEMLNLFSYSVSNGGGEEWQPAGFTSNDLDPAMADVLAGIESGLPLNRGEKNADGFLFSVDDTVRDNAGYLIPYVYYKGYTMERLSMEAVSEAVLESKEGNGENIRAKKDGKLSESREIISTQKDPESGLLKCGALEEGTYRVFYSGTPIQRISYTVNLLALLFGGVCVAYFRKKDYTNG